MQTRSSITDCSGTTDLDLSTSSVLGFTLGSWRSTVDRHWSVLVVALITAAVTICPPYRNGPPIRSDGDGYHYWTYAFLKGDLAFTWHRGSHPTVGLVRTDPVENRFACKYPPGVAIIRLPLMALVTDPSRDGPPYSPAEHAACLVAGALALVATCMIGLFSCLRLGASPRAAHLAVLTLTFGTGLFHYGTYDASFSHVYSALGCALLVWLAIDARQSREGQLHLVATLLTLALLVLVRNTNVLLVAFWASAHTVYAWTSSTSPFRLAARNFAVVAFGMGMGVAIQLGLNFHSFGRLQLSSYAGEAFDFTRCMAGAVLWSADRGLFTYYPVLGVVFVAGLATRPLRMAAIALGGLVLAVALLYGYWWSWQLGAGFGHRGFVETVPFFVPAFALTLDALSHRARRYVLSASVVATCACLLVMAAYWRGSYPMGGATVHHYLDQVTLKAYRHAYWMTHGQLPPHLRRTIPAGR